MPVSMVRLLQKGNAQAHTFWVNCWVTIVFGSACKTLYSLWIHRQSNPIVERPGAHILIELFGNDSVRIYLQDTVESAESCTCFGPMESSCVLDISILDFWILVAPSVYLRSCISGNPHEPWAVRAAQGVAGHTSWRCCREALCVVRGRQIHGLWFTV